MSAVSIIFSRFIFASYQQSPERTNKLGTHLSVPGEGILPDVPTDLLHVPLFCDAVLAVTISGNAAFAATTADAAVMPPLQLWEGILAK